MYNIVFTTSVASRCQTEDKQATMYYKVRKLFRKLWDKSV